ncbi:hypothetical protein MES5069_220061 [Mesorhizobium escarrei]|uniref:Uncharacterized protein n=1 Tax=Mesorhizobium escarrei TaxID=666018 RepID=A0ABM9DRG2_9HYPH|nr:hypothetical protein MES5069_220061 [Mesorhizobium escarrei]
MVDGQRAHDIRIDADGNADEGHWYVFGDPEHLHVGGGESRMNRDVLGGQGRVRGHNMVDCLPRQIRPAALTAALGPAGAYGDFQFAITIEERDDAVPHLQKRSQEVYDLGQRDFEPGGGGECFHYFPYASKHARARRQNSGF